MVTNPTSPAAGAPTSAVWVSSTAEIQANFDKLEGETTRQGPAFGKFPLYVVHPACETSQNAQKSSRL
jgi:hypothetical protein